MSELITVAEAKTILEAGLPEHVTVGEGVTERHRILFVLTCAHCGCSRKLEMDRQSGAITLEYGGECKTSPGGCPLEDAPRHTPGASATTPEEPEEPEKDPAPEGTTPEDLAVDPPSPDGTTLTAPPESPSTPSE